MVFNVVDGDVVMYKTNENNEILINVNGDTNIFYFTDSSVVEAGNYNVHNLEYVKEYFSNRIESQMIQGMYASLFAFSRKSDYGMVSEILKAENKTWAEKQKKEVCSNSVSPCFC
jgi:hypothetical protein